MKEQMNWVKRLNLVHVKRLNQHSLHRLHRLYTFLTVPTANRPSHERLNNANIIISSKNYAISTVLWVLSHLAQWHNVLAFRTSGTSGNLREPQEHAGKFSHFRDDPLACWHTSGMLAHWHTCWHSRQTHGIQTNDEHTASHSGRLQTPDSYGQFMVSQVYVTSVDLRQSSETAPTH